ncbi:hypothetical protein GCM10011585_05650 [Edaphobacter dinghuensis]|uniref:Uncharacterized protein n=1 Tax=Edaphobacter dinghuensis TaxID=1560005 RepID=A0A917H3C3_9BACT|nr:hypothetical protein GCM10011585_05650 [Edaphobacter dinghuensis]
MVVQSMSQGRDMGHPHPGFVPLVDEGKYRGLSAAAAKAPPSVEMTCFSWCVRFQESSVSGVVSRG